jgi:hypothetical protein
MDLLSKENTSVAKPTERTKPTLVTIGDKQVISNGRWNDGLVADWVSLNAREKFVTVGKLAGVLGANTIPNKKRVRKGLSALFMEFRKRGLFLAVEYNGDHNAATAVKVADIRSEEDRQLVTAKLKRMRRSKELSAEQYEGAMAVINAMEAEQMQEVQNRYAGFEDTASP